MQLIKPVAIALKGKGPAALLKRVQTIGKRYGVTPSKMDRSLEQLAHLLQQFDCRATLPITTVALARNSEVIKKYQAEGIEFAIHGYRHIDHSQLSSAEQEIHFRRASQIFQEQGVHFAGFRCPYLRWNEGTLVALSQTSLVYDSSNSLVWDVVEAKHCTESYYRAIEFYGAQPAKDYLALPGLDLEKNLVRIPYCLPDDESLVERMVWDAPDQMDQVWPMMFREIHEQGELFNLGLHPERTKDCAGGLLATLKEVQKVGPIVWRARLAEIAAWWKARYEARVEITTAPNTLQLDVNGPPGTTLLLRAVETKTATEPWFDGYRRATEGPCQVSYHQKRPFIGVSPTSSPSLVSFLKQQGYIVEQSTQPDLYTFYLDRPDFTPDQERPLVTHLETADFSLARLGRWPYGARSAFCVTGDIDALTVWDYGLRFVGY